MKKYFAVVYKRAALAPALVLLMFLVAALPARAQKLLDINFAGGNKQGLAAAGLSTNDYWNLYTAPFSSDSTLTNLLWADKTPSGINMRVQGAPGAWSNSTGDAMFDSYSYNSDGSSLVVQITGIPAGTYDAFVYAHGATDAENAAITVNGQTKQTGVGPYWNNNQLATGNWIENAHYVVFRNVAVADGTPFLITANHSGTGTVPMNGIQIISAELNITKPPVDQQVPQGGTAVFSVTVASSSPNLVSYQWLFNDHPIVGETNAQLVIKNVNNFYIGTYEVKVSFGNQSVTSNPVQLSILPFAINLYTALEIEFPTQIGKHYQVQGSQDLVHWTNIGDPVDGTGQLVQKLISIRTPNSKYFQVLEQ